MAKRVAKLITSDEDIKFLLNINAEQACSSSFMMDNFGAFENRPPRFHPYDLFNVPIGAYGKIDKKNKNSFTTTVGLWVFNKAFIEDELFDIIGYVNEPITKKVFSKINTKLSYALMEDKIPLSVMVTLYSYSLLYLSNISFNDKKLTTSLLLVLLSCEVFLGL